MNMKTIKEWIDTLPADIRQRACKYQDWYWNESKKEDLNIAIVAAIDFNKSTEGFNFWFRVGLGQFDEARALLPKPRLPRLTWHDFRDTDYYYNLEDDLKGWVDILDLLQNPKVHPWEKLWAFTREGIVRKETRELWRKKVIEKFGEFVPIGNRRVLHTVEYYLKQEQEVELAIEAINETYNTAKP